MRDKKQYGERNVESYRSPESREAYAEVADQGLNEAEASVILRYFVRGGGRVLDVGCGTGRTTRPLDRMGLDVVGVDVSEPMIREATERAPEIPFLAGDVTALCFEDESFDCALFSYNGIDLLWPERKRHEALREIYRVLKPGGTFVFSARNAWWLPIPPESPRSPRSWIRSGVSIAYDLLAGQFTPHYRETNIGIWNGDWEEEGVSYFIDPPSQKRQLRNHGFKVVDVYGGYFHANPHYVAWKPIE